MDRETEMPGAVLGTACNDANGVVTFSDIPYVPMSEAPYDYYTYYYFREIPGTDDNILYDSSLRLIFIQTRDRWDSDPYDEPRVMQIYKMENEFWTNVQEVGSLDFENWTVVPAKLPLKALKYLDDVPDSSGDFQFQLVDGATNEVVKTARNGSGGEIDFGDLVFKSVGTYTYFIRELVGSRENTIYDPSLKRIVVTVDADTNGQLFVGNVEKSSSATGSTGDMESVDSFEFRNTTSETPPSPPPPSGYGQSYLLLSKQIVGGDPETEFTFTLDLPISQALCDAEGVSLEAKEAEVYGDGGSGNGEYNVVPYGLQEYYLWELSGQTLYSEAELVAILRRYAVEAGYPEEEWYTFFSEKLAEIGSPTIPWWFPCLSAAEQTIRSARTRRKAG